MASQIAELFARIGADLSGLERGVGQAENILTSAGKKMSSLGSDLTRNLTVPLAALGGLAAKSAIELDEQMRNIQSISQGTDAEIAQLSDTFVEMSTDISKTTDTAKNLAAGFYQIQSSGFAGAGAMEVLEKATKAGSAGLSTTAVAATALAGTLNAYGLGADQAGRISDVLFETVNRGVVSFDELGGSIGQVVGTAAQSGVSFETVSAAIATMTKQGLSGAESVVSLNQLLLSLIKPSEDAAAAIQSLGYSSGQAMLDALGLQGTLQALSDAGYNSTEAMASLFPNVRALRGALALTGEGAQMFVEDMGAMTNAAGATDAAFQQQTQSWTAQLKNFRNELSATGQVIGEQILPPVMEFLGWVKQQAEAFRGLEPETQKNIIALAGIAATVGPALKIVGGLATGLGTLAGWFGKLAPYIGTAVSAIGAFIPQLTAAIQLMWAGEGVLAVASAGFAGLAAAALPVVAALALVAAGWKKFIAPVQTEGLEGTATAWGQMFDEMVTKGASAAEIADQFSAAQARVNEQLEAGGVLAKLFVDKQEIMDQGGKEAAAAILEASRSYGEYYANLQRVGLAGQAVTVSFYNQVKGLTELNLAQANQEMHLEQIAMRQEQVTAAQARAEMQAAAYAQTVTFLNDTMASSQDETDALADAHRGLSGAASTAAEGMTRQAKAIQAAQEAADAMNLERLEEQLGQDLGSPLTSFIEDLQFMIASGGADFAGAFEAIKQALANNEITPEEAAGFSGELLAAIENVKVAAGQIDTQTAITNIAETLKIPFEEAKKLFEEAGNAAEVVAGVTQQIADAQQPATDLQTAIENINGAELSFDTLAAQTSLNDTTTDVDELFLALADLPRTIPITVYVTTVGMPDLGVGAGTVTTTPAPVPDETEDTTSTFGNPDAKQVAEGGDTYNITVNNTMAAALVMAEIDTRRRARLGERMGG